MINKLPAALKYSGTMAVILMTVIANQANSTEYVFSAPPEVDNNIVEEIPAQEADYPFYDCNTETSEHETTEVNEENDNRIDSHNCDCIDCEEATSEEQKHSKVTSRNKQKNKKHNYN